MEYVYAAILLNEADTEITKRSVTRTLESVGVDVDPSRVRALTTGLDDADIESATDAVKAGPYVYAALLLNEVDAEITKRSVTETLESADVDVDPSRVESLLSSLEGVDVREAVQEASSESTTDEDQRTASTTDEDQRTASTTDEDQRTASTTDGEPPTSATDTDQPPTSTPTSSEASAESETTGRTGGQNSNREETGILSNLLGFLNADGEGARREERSGLQENDSRGLLSDAEDMVSAGDTARENEEFRDAIASYEEALDRYEAAKEEAGTERDEASVKGAIAETQNKLQTVRARKERIDAVRGPLQDAESSLQTAIAGHVQNDVIPARRDYRQARSQYEQALDALEEAEADVFEEEGAITVAVSLEAGRFPSKLVAWDDLSDDEVRALSEAGIGTVADIRNAGDELIRELGADEAIDEELIDRLRAVKWWHGEDERTFTSRRAIERQRDRADEGHQMLS